MKADRAPWPVIAGLAAFAAFDAVVATRTTSELAAAFMFASAALLAYIACHFIAASIVDRISRRRTPPPAPRLTPLEAAILCAHGYTEDQWNRLDDSERAYLRGTYTKAERYIR